MAGLKNESLGWVEQIEAIQAQPSQKRADLIKALDLKKSHIGDLLNLKACFDPKALEKVRRAAQGSPPYVFSFNKAMALTRLKGKVPDLPQAVHAALDLAITRRLSTLHLTALTAHLASGKPATGFDPRQFKRKKSGFEPPEPSPRSQELLGQEEAPSGQAGAPAHSPVSQPETTLEQTEATPIRGAKTSQPKLEGTSASSVPAGPSMFLEELAGIPFFKQIQKKVKAGQKLHWWETLYLVFHDALKGLALAGKDGVKPLFKILGEYGKKLVHGLFKFIHGAFKGLANLIAPLPHSSHSSGKHGTRSTTGPSPQALLQVVLHWTVYGLCWLVLGEFLGSLVPSLKPWVEFPFRYMAYLLFMKFPAWAWTQAQIHLVVALIVGALLLIGLGVGFSKSPGRMILLLLLLGAGWFYGRRWGTATPPNIFSQTKAVEPQRHEGTKGSDANGLKKEETAKVVEPPISPSAPRKTEAPPAPVLSSKPRLGTGKKHSPQPPAPQSQAYVTSSQITVPEDLKDRVEFDSNKALQFAVAFYGTSYRTENQWQDYFQKELAGDYSQAFFDAFFPSSRVEEIEQKKLSQSFRYSGPMELLGVDNQSVIFLVNGAVTTQDDSSGVVGSPLNVSLLVGIRRDGKVFKVEAQQ